MVPFTINLLVKLCINSDIKVAFTFLNKIYEAIESELKNGTLAANQKKKIAKEESYHLLSTSQVYSTRLCNRYGTYRYVCTDVYKILLHKTRMTHAVV